jgi:hypothetical protein
MFVLIIFVIFTDTHSRIYRWLGGAIHCLAHFACIFYIAWGVSFMSGKYVPSFAIFQLLFEGGIVFLLGWIVGSFVMGLYLLMSLNVFGRHEQEAFSALRIEDYKNFLRMHISADGTLTIYPIKIKEVPRKWRKRKAEEADKTSSRVVPVGGSGPELIEDPIRILPKHDITTKMI